MAMHSSTQTLDCGQQFSSLFILFHSILWPAFGTYYTQLFEFSTGPLMLFKATPGIYKIHA
jgi:hypothetical protein